MLIRPLDFVVNYVTNLNSSLERISSSPLTKSQSGWLITVLMGFIVVGSFNWAAFARKSLGAFKESRLRWIFRHAKYSMGKSASSQHHVHNIPLWHHCRCFSIG